jgi:death on curing protein
VSTVPWQHLISVQVIQELHDENIRRFGGNPSPSPIPGCIEASLGAAWNAELYAGIDNAIPGLCFGGCLLYYLHMNHCFVDGNKRVAWAAWMEVLRSLGFMVNATDDEVEQLFLDIINESIKNAVDVVFWLAPKLDSPPL